MWAGERVQLSLTLHREPLPLLASESHLERAINNLVHNAIEAMGDGGKLTIATRECVLEASTAQRENVRVGRYAILQVSDTGRGIPVEDLKRIFEPFFSSKRMSDRSGSGLGLAIVDGVVKDHGGFIAVSSTPGKGTSFSLHFPLEAREVQRAQPKPEVRGGTGRILVIDDDPVQLRTATRLLEHFGYDVDAIESGARAYARLESNRHTRPDARVGESPYDLMIVDMELNEAEDGIQLLTRISRLFPEQKAIISSGHAHGDQLERSLLPKVSWLAKPYTAGSLAAAVHTALSPEHDADRSARAAGRKRVMFNAS
jgi:CheY-like chemotaxis protein